MTTRTAMTAAATRRVWVEQIMGMPVSIHLRGDVDESAETVVTQAFSHLRRVDEVFSTWRADSDLMRVRWGDLAESDAHPWLADVRELCAEAERRTRGLFSATLPGAEGRPVFDPTGLVKGWAVEGAARHLALSARTAFCINAGGDIVAGRGRHAKDPRPWRIGIEDPRERASIAATVDLTAGALATSGNAARGAHITDPRTGQPVARPGSSTVTGPSLLWADIWATALFVDPAAGARAMGAQDPAYRCLVL